LLKAAGAPVRRTAWLSAQAVNPEFLDARATAWIVRTRVEAISTPSCKNVATWRPAGCVAWTFIQAWRSRRERFPAQVRRPRPHDSAVPREPCRVADAARWGVETVGRREWALHRTRRRAPEVDHRRPAMIGVHPIAPTRDRRCRFGFRDA
jgi:hypothetical protein